MAAPKTPKPLRTRGGAWGRQRVELGISMRELERRSGVSRSTLSFVEGGRVIPTSDELGAVMAVLQEEAAKLGRPVFVPEEQSA